MCRIKKNCKTNKKNIASCPKPRKTIHPGLAILAVHGYNLLTFGGSRMCHEMFRKKHKVLHVLASYLWSMQTYEYRGMAQLELLWISRKSAVHASAKAHALGPGAISYLFSDGFSVQEWSGHGQNTKIRDPKPTQNSKKHGKHSKTLRTCKLVNHNCKQLDLGHHYWLWRKLREGPGVHLRGIMAGYTQCIDYTLYHFVS